MRADGVGTDSPNVLPCPAQSDVTMSEPADKFSGRDVRFKSLRSEAPLVEPPSELAVPSPPGGIAPGGNAPGGVGKPGMIRRPSSCGSVFGSFSRKSLWTPPPLRKTRSFDEGLIPWDLHVTVKVKTNDEGRRELRIGVRCYGKFSSVAIPIRILCFWIVLLLALLPSGAFMVGPGMRMSSYATQRTASRAGHSSTAATPIDVGHDTLGLLRESPQAGLFSNSPLRGLSPDHECFVDAAGMSGQSELETLEQPVLDEIHEACETFDECILDAEGEDGLMECMEQIHTSSLEEISGLIAKEGASLLATADDGTLSCLVYHLLDTVKHAHSVVRREQETPEGGVHRSTDIRMIGGEATAEHGSVDQAVDEAVEAAQPVQSVGVLLRRQAYRTCVSISMHKLTVAALPLVTGLLHMSGHH